MSVAFITGNAFTLTVISFVTFAPSLSTTLYTTGYFPASFVFTPFFSIVTFVVMSLSSWSYAFISNFIASSSVNSSPTFIVLGVAFITGNAFTLTFISFVTFAPSLSTTLYTTAYSPATSGFTSFLSIVAFVVISLSSWSTTLISLSASSFVNLSPTFIILEVAFITGNPFTLTFISFVTFAPSLSATLYTTAYSPATSGFTSFFSIVAFVVISLSSWSTTLISLSASSFVNLSPTFIVLGVAFITGNPFTLTFISFVAFAPYLSTTLYTTLYSPGSFVFTSFSSTVTFVVMSPSSLSSTLISFNASLSVNVSPTFIVLVVVVITGNPFTLILISFVVVALLLSSTLYTTLYSPGVFISTLFSTTVALVVILPSSWSTTFISLSASSSVNLSPTFIVLDVAFITGNPFTVTTISLVTVVPLLSATLYVTVYFPGVSVFTLLI